MPKNCFVPGCKTTFKTKRKRKPGEKMLTFFSAPKDPMLRKQWHIASRRGDREMTEKDVICELHFRDDCLSRHFTTELFDGSIFKLERTRPALKKGSIPTIFPFSKSNSSERGQKKFRVDHNKQEESGSKKRSRTGRLTKNLQIDECDSSDADGNERYSRGMGGRSDPDFHEPGTEMDYFVQDENEEMSSSNENDMPSTSEDLIEEGHEIIFGKFVASELRILSSCDPSLYKSTKRKICRVLEGAIKML